MDPAGPATALRLVGGLALEEWSGRDWRPRPPLEGPAGAGARQVVEAVDRVVDAWIVAGGVGSLSAAALALSTRPEGPVVLVGGFGGAAAEVAGATAATAPETLREGLTVLRSEDRPDEAARIAVALAREWAALRNVA